MTKFLFTTAGVAAVLTLLSGGRRYAPAPLFGQPRARPRTDPRPARPPLRTTRLPPARRQRPFPADGAYLRALADVHDYCPDDYMRLCTKAGTEMEDAPKGLQVQARRLATLLIDVRAVDADAEDHGPSHHAAPLRLGRGRDTCLRANFDALSTECQAAVALVDEAAEAMPKHHGACPVMVSLFFGALLGLVFLGRKVRAKKAVMAKVLEAIRADTQLQALVEAKAGVEVPAPCQCKGGRLLGAAAFAVVLSMLVGAPTVIFASLLSAACCKCCKCCRRCCGPKAGGGAPADYAALDTEKQAPSLLAASTQRDEKAEPLL